MTEHPTEQVIRSILVVDNVHTNENYTIGSKGVTKIEPFTKSGMYADIPYLRVWKGEFVHSEFCQHQIIGVYFERG